MDEYAEPSEPACAQHPDQTAQVICARCGGYMCSLCDKGGTYQNCEPCRRLTGEDYFPLNRENFRYASAFDLAWSRFKVQWPILCVGTLIVIGSSLALSFGRQILMLPFGQVMDDKFTTVPALIFMGALMVGSMFIEGAVTWTLNVGFLRVCFDVLTGRPASIGRLFGQFRKIGKVVLQGMAAMFAVGLPAALWVFFIVSAAGMGNDWVPGLALAALAFFAGLIPFVYYALPFFFMQAELALGEDTGPVEAIVNAALVIRGKRWVALGTISILGLLSFLGILCCFIGMVPAWALGQLIVSCVYLALRTGSEVTAPTEEWREY